MHRLKLVLILTLAFFLIGCQLDEDPVPCISLVDHMWVDHGGSGEVFSVIGEVKNEMHVPAFSVVVIARHYDSNGCPIGEDWAVTDPGTLDPNECGVFDIYCGTLPQGHDHTDFLIEWTR